MRGLLLRRLTPFSPKTEVLGILCGISSPFGELFPIRGQITHVLRTRAPCAIPYCYGTRTRLACVKHAASVRSEPGSNSRLKPVAWAIKKMLRFESEPACPSKLLIARCYSTIRARIRPNGFERILAHRIGCQRATASLSSRVASKQLCNYSEHGSECQHPGTKKFGISTRLPPRTCKLLRRREIQAMQHCRANRFTRFGRLGQVAKIASRLREILDTVGSGHTLAVRYFLGYASFLLSLSSIANR